MVKVKDIAFTGTPVTDMKKARAFYEGVFGLTPAHVFEQGDCCWLEYDIGPGKATLAITDYNPEWKPSAAGTTIAFEIADFDATIAHLKTHNVAFLGEPYESPVCRMALISDPDGNTIIIHQCKQTA
jgi:predicted enzyme related to lactoylglutathione lyase